MNRLTDPQQCECIGLSVCGGGCESCPADNEFYVRLCEYENALSNPDGTVMSPAEVADHEEMFKAYRHVCGGLPPEEIGELTQAKREGRLVVLPCKVGDTVYIKGVPLIISFIHIEDDVHYAIQFDCDDCDGCPFYEDEVSWEGEHDCKRNGYLEFSESDIGKTVFLTREAAEAEKEREEHV